MAGAQAQLMRYLIRESCGIRFLHSSVLRTAGKKRKARRELTLPTQSSRPIVEVYEKMQLKKFAEVTGVELSQVIRALQGQGFRYVARATTTVNSRQLLAKLANDFGFKARFVPEPSKPVYEENIDIAPRPMPPESALVTRPPVVTIMGHVDHGKTTLLDSLRHSQIVKGEFGGITQHIGAFMVTLNGERLTFLDTPGHAAFKAMRERGAKVTDIVVLVVAADDGVLDQTKESIRYAREAHVPIVVAINKVDKSNADVEKTKKSLLDAGVYLEEFGGTVQAVEISALKNQHLDELMEAILVEAEVHNVRGDPTGLVEGAVIEVKTVKGLGALSTVLIHRGTLKKGAILVAGQTWCKVRSLTDEHRRPMKEAGLSSAVEISGWREGLPSAGDVMLETESEQRAKEVVAYRKQQALLAKGEAASAASELERTEAKDEHWKKKLERYKLGFMKIRERGEFQRTVETIGANRLDILLKGDVDGSVGAIMDVLATYNSPQVALTLIDVGVGPVSEADVELAAAFNGLIYAFNVPIDAAAQTKAGLLGVLIRPFNIIYRLVEDLKVELTSRIEPIPTPVETGHGVIIQRFRIPIPNSNRWVYVAGTKCNSGKIKISDKIKVLQKGGEVIFDGAIESLHVEKDRVTSVKAEQNVGILLKDSSNVKFDVGDEIVCYNIEQRKAELDWKPPGF